LTPYQLPDAAAAATPLQHRDAKTKKILLHFALVSHRPVAHEKIKVFLLGGFKFHNEHPG
jgi:hypothetical protein